MADSDDLPPWAPPESAPPAGDPLPYPEPPPRRRSPAALVGLVVGVLALIGGGVFAATQLAGDESSPEGAAERLFDAFGNEDLLGVLEALPPSERDALRPSLEDLADELKRLQILSGDLDLNDLSGVDATFEDLEFSSEPLADHLAMVSIDRGTVRTTTNPSDLPLGDFVKDLAGDSLSTAEPTTDTESAAEDDVLVALKEDGRWYVSLWYTVAEAARESAGAARPDFSQRVQAAGASSPEAAVDAFIRGAATLDLRRLIQLFPPDEARALHDYAPLFLDQVEQAVGDVRQLFHVDISTLDLAAKEDGDRALVQVRAVEFDARATNGEFGVSYRDGCATLSDGSGEQRQVCGEELRNGAGLFGPLAGADLSGLDVSNPELGFVTVRRDDQWYVSPTRTLLDNITATLHVLDRQDLDKFADLFGGFFGVVS